ncbi:hypothetical protein B0T10DRAFT_569138 [Thelonectria olida]|uniref:PD-(D/E)XK nuclease-like domain-containing protein n=1 Tax=Thelonectria olida TaxID=1576542 RepID=A0A9P8VRM1_9HYPO|nr:hypothetical protein B0T10DRAFT_569138 [Thelonectria olida]
MNQPDIGSFDDFVEGWLDSIVPWQHSSKAYCHSASSPSFAGAKLDWDDMPTPPESASTPTRRSHPHQRSPKRRRPEEAVDASDAAQFHASLVGDDPFDNDKTPDARPYAKAFSIPSRPTFHHTPSQSSTNASSTQSGSRASHTRSGSPVKRSTLDLLKKPLRFITMNVDPTGQLPEDITSLYDRIVGITLHREDFLPRSVEPDLTATHRRGTLRPGWFFDDGAADTTARHKEEYKALCNILEAADICKVETAAESTWNLEVHGPLLKLAFEPFPSLRRDLLTAARISKPFLPEMQAGTMYDYTRAKMIDMGVRVCPPPPIAEGIRQMLIGQPEPTRCVNQTTYGPVRNHPIALAIETKIAMGELEEARLQLGVWVAAWHQRIQMLVDASPLLLGVDRIITLPLIIVMEHDWRLLFACDRGDRIEVLEDISIGDTKSLIGLYTIMATLRALASWMQKDYVDWLQRLFSPSG